MRDRTQGRVIVVGAGVSGCSCAATLAALGIRVTLINPALDRVGEPGFGPLLVGEGGVASEEAGAMGGQAEGRPAKGPLAKGPPAVGTSVLRALPSGLADAWLEGAMRSEDESVVVVDRRLVSVRTKHTIEQMDGLELRQGLVVQVAIGADGDDDVVEGCGRVQVQTAFDETLSGDAVVVAVGMGGFGQAPCGGLESVLRALGADLAPSRLYVWPRYGAGVYGGVSPVLLRRMVEREGTWGEGAPPSPYEVQATHTALAWVGESGEGTATVLAAPDGLATGEVAIFGGLAREGDDEAPVASRPGYVAEGMWVTNVDDSGRLESADGARGAVWVTGRAAGARSYLDSLAAGMRTAEAVARALESGE